jgi:hypothetical protein
MCSEQIFLKILLGCYTFNETTITRKLYFVIADNFASTLSEEGKVIKFSARRRSASLQ